ncbi:hypothetical protein Hanom_Chr16g01415801 [Helianthus anomalus]
MLLLAKIVPFGVVASLLPFRVSTCCTLPSMPIKAPTQPNMHRGLHSTQMITIIE